MFKSRAVQRAPEPVFEAGQDSGYDQWADDDGLVDLAAYMDSRGIPVTGAAPAAGYHGGGAMDPVDLHTGRSVRQPGPNGFDPWDDDALERIADELSDFDDFDPNILPEGVLAPHPDEEIAAAPRTVGRRRGLVLAGIAAVALLGVATIGYGLLGGPAGFGEPQLVRAPTGPYKVVPEPGEKTEDTIESDIVFNRAESLPPKGEERLLTRPEEVPALPGVVPQVNRVILPDGTEVAPEPVSPADFGPRRVRTVLVKPDGTIIEAPEDPAPRLRSAAETSLLQPILATEPVAESAALPSTETEEARIIPVSGTEAGDDLGSSGGLPPIPESELDLPPLPGETVPTAATPAVEPVAQEVAELQPDPALVAPVAVRTPPVRPAVIPAEPTAVAAEPAASPVAPSSGPLDLAAAAAAPATREVAAVQPVEQPAPVAEAPAAPAAATAPAPAGSAFVQLASQRSEEAALATFQALQRRFPSLLGGLSPDIQRADLGSKGVYYRVRVPQPSRDQAAGLCDNLRSAGGDCLIARN